MKSNETCVRDIAKGVLAGLVGGLIGTIVMTEFQNAWSAASQKLKEGNNGQQSGSDQNEQSRQEESTTMKAAGKLGEVAGYPLSHDQKKKLGPIVHYCFGTLQGVLYGASMEAAGNCGGMLAGLVFGVALFVLADEVAVPALGLSAKPSEIPLPSHIYGMAAHLVYGISSEIARRGVRAA